MVKNSYKAIGIIILQMISLYVILIISALIFPYVFQAYWTPPKFVCPPDTYCMGGDFRSNEDFLLTFFFNLILIQIVNFLLFRVWLNSLKITKKPPTLVL